VELDLDTEPRAVAEPADLARALRAKEKRLADEGARC
jgi:hypothetical protein